MADERAPEAPEQAESRHATWLELFFDLMAVAGVAALAHLLHEDVTWHGVLTYTIAFTAFWVIWAVYTTYGNVKGDDAHTATMLGGMVALGVMTAAVPGIDGDHARAFAIAYIVARVMATRPWSRTQVVVDLPVVQASVTVLPWIASLWVTPDARPWLWAVGLAGDIALIVRVDGMAWLRRSQERLDAANARIADERAKRAAAGKPVRGRGGRLREFPTTMSAALADAEHLAERMGLFVLIVLGEGLVQVVSTASHVEWDRALLAAALWAFALLLALWFLAVDRGHAGVALATVGAIPLRLTWLAHLVATGSLVMAASMLGAVIERPHDPLESHERWVLLAALGIYAVLAASVHAATGRWRLAAVAGAPLAVAAGAAAAWADATGAQTLAVLALGGIASTAAAIRRN